MKLRTEIVLAIAATIASCVIVSCSDVKEPKQPQCLDTVKEFVPVPLHIGRMNDGGAAVVGFEKIIVIVTKPTVEFSLEEDLAKNGFKHSGVCYAKLPTSGEEQEYQVYQKAVGTPQ